MADPRFFSPLEPLTLGEIAVLTGARLIGSADPATRISGIAALNAAGSGDLSFVEGPAYLAELRATKAAACFCPAKLLAEVPPATAALETRRPNVDFAKVAGRLFPTALGPTAVWPVQGISGAALVHAKAQLEEGVVVEPFAVIGEGAAIGRGSYIGAGAVIGPFVQIGRGCSVGPGATVVHALIGDTVMIHAGVRIGQDGFGFIPDRKGHHKVPQIGRVIIQDRVELGANTTVDRGSVRDTIIGEGTKIDNLCQVAHNVVIGRHCLIAAHVGVGGSVTMGDFVAIGGHSGIADHLTIGDGANLGGGCGLMHDIPPGGRWFGTPARPVREWLRSQAIARGLARDTMKRLTGEEEK